MADVVEVGNVREVCVGEAQARRVEAEAAAWSIPDLLSLDRASLEELPVFDLSNLRFGR